MSDPIDPTVDQQPIDAPARLAPVPPSLVATRTALHALAEGEISAARKEATGKIGLRATPGGFGTPVFGEGRQLRVEGAELVTVAAGVETARRPIDGIEPGAAALLADWFALGAHVLAALRAAAPESSEPSMIQLWPEHFDIAMELGNEAAGQRAAYGFSPGDEQHPEPYIYVAPWNPPQDAAMWNAVGFTGAEMAYGSLPANGGEATAAAWAFLDAAFRELTE